MHGRLQCSRTVDSMYIVVLWHFVAWELGSTWPVSWQFIRFPCTIKFLSFLPRDKHLLSCWLGDFLPSVLWRCWLDGRKGIRPVKTEWWRAGVVICLELGADLHMAQLMPVPLTVSCFSKIQIGFAFLVPASPGKRAVKRVCVCFCVSHKIYFVRVFAPLCLLHPGATVPSVPR